MGIGNPYSDSSWNLSSVLPNDLKIKQVVQQQNNQPELFSGLEMKIRQDIEHKTQFLVHTAGVAFEFGSDRYNPRSKTPDFKIDFL